MADSNSNVLDPHVELRAAVADLVAASSKEVRITVVNDLAKEEITRRVASVKVVLVKVEDSTKALKKLVDKEGTYTFNTNGDKVGEPTFTKDQAGKIKQLREEITKFHAALTKAFNEGDFSKVLEVGGKSQGGGDKSQGGGDKKPMDAE